MTVKVYDTDDPASDHAPFLGTELLLRADIYENGEPPCPQEGTAHWHPLDFGYYACHHS